MGTYLEVGFTAFVRYMLCVLEIKSKTGLILLNLGTPASYAPADVGKYLREFLMDPFVVDIPAPLRWFLVNALIVPRRSFQSAALYKKVWTEEGSPLFVYTVGLARAVAKVLGDGFVVEPAMRYGQPSILGAVERLKTAGVTQVITLPLYPQYSLAATESSIQQVRATVAQVWPGTPVKFVPPFFADARYLDAVTEVSRPHLEGVDKVLFSFHGLPERQVKKTDVTRVHCLRTPTCCETPGPVLARCYRAQSYATAHRLAQKLGLAPGSWEVGFQSRLGRTPWIQPYSDVLYERLAREGVRRLAVMTPSFVADCLETLEEVAIRGKESFVEAGGGDLVLVPSLNTHPRWVQALSEMVQEFELKAF